MPANVLALAWIRRRHVLLVVLALIVLAGAGVLVRGLRAPRPNIVLVTFDTTRADRLGAYGYGQGLTTAFDEFAKNGVLFEQAYAPAPITLPSHATMLTGLYPPEHGLRVNGSGKLDHEIPVLTEILKENGYDTGAFIAAVVLDSVYGLDRGFDVYEDNVGQSARHHGERRRDGKEVVDAALAWLQQRTDKPFFCWIHLYDAHAPYDPRPEQYQEQFAAQPYDAGVAWAVAQFARVTDYLRTKQLTDRTVVVVAGDHGEGLDEHQEHEHGMLVYNTTLVVPFVAVGPDYFEPGTRVDTAVSLVDLTPTLLDLLRIESARPMTGRSLLAAMQGGSLEPRDIYAEAETPYSLNHWCPLSAVVSDGWKYIQSTKPELYDLRQDPGELQNLLESEAENAERLSGLLIEIEQQFVRAEAGEANLSGADVANLQALGYVSGGAVSDASTRDADLPDVKDFLPEVSKFEEAKHLSLEGKSDDAIGLLREVVEATDQFPAANLLLGDCLAQAGRLDEAAEAYQALLAKHPDFEKVHQSLSRVRVEQGRFEDAAAELRELIRKSPDSAVARLELAQVLSRLGKPAEGIEVCREALRRTPELAAGHVVLGQLLQATGKPGDAAASFEQALRYDPEKLDAHVNLFFVLSQLGEFNKAIRHGQKAVELAPDSFENRFNLGVLLISQGRTQDGIAQLREAEKLRPDDPRPRQHIEQAERSRPRGIGGGGG